jgi:hypothetical protein
MLLGWSLGWLVGVAVGRQRAHYEHDLTGAMIVTLLALLATLLVYRWSLRRWRRVRAEDPASIDGWILLAVMIAAGVLGLGVFALAALGVLR